MASNTQFENRPDAPETGLHARLQRAARSFQYPPTPDLVEWEKQRATERLDGRDRLAAGNRTDDRSRRVARKVALGIAWTLVAVVLLAGLILVSPARARVIEWLRVGAVRLHLVPDSTPIPVIQPEALSGLAGETSLLQAAAQAPFTLRLPSYPPDLKEPQRVYAQQINGASVVIMVWLQPGAPQEVRLVLYQIGEGDVFFKQLLQNVQETTVGSNWALWVTGPYLLTTTGGQVEQRRIVQGHTLIWTDRQTFRLETDLPLEEARKIAESLQEWPGR